MATKYLRLDPYSPYLAIHNLTHGQNIIRNGYNILNCIVPGDINSTTIPVQFQGGDRLSIRLVGAKTLLYVLLQYADDLDVVPILSADFYTPLGGDRTSGMEIITDLLEPRDVRIFIAYDIEYGSLACSAVTTDT